MMLMLRDDHVIEIFESAPTVRDGIEVIDIENQEYQFCDQDGQRYVGVVVKKGRWLKSSNFELRPEGAADIANALRLLDSAVGLETNKRFTDLEAVRAYLLKNP
jgi:hypothetical protein